MYTPKISIVVPVYKMERADHFLTTCLDSIIEQTFEDFEVVIPDNCPDDSLEKIVRTYGMRINYFKSDKIGCSANTNEGMRKAKGELIKILHMDDCLASKTSLQEIADGFKGHWLITASDNNRLPHYTKDIHLGNNRLGSPSALTVLNKNILKFNEKMVWLFDCEYYRRMYDLYGEPVILKKIGVNIGLHGGQMTRLISDDVKIAETGQMYQKYGNIK